MPLSIPLQLVEEMPDISRETCLNFVLFRNLIKAHRSKCDDKIIQRLNSITDLRKQCQNFEDNLRRAHESRIRNLKFCSSVLDEELQKTVVIDRNLIAKEVLRVFYILFIF